MSNVSVNRIDFLNFLNFLSLKNEVENNEAVINISKKAITVLLATANSALALQGTLTGSFADIGELGIDKIATLKNLLKSFTSATVDLEVIQNKLVITAPKSKTKVTSLLRNIDYIKNRLDAAKFKTIADKAIGNEFNLSKEQLKELLTYANSLASEELILVGKDSGISLELKDYPTSANNELETAFDIKETVVPFKARFSKFIFYILSTCVNNGITLSVNDKMPIYLKYTEGNTSFEYLLAPLK